MAKVSTGLTLTTDFYLNNFYSENRKVHKEANRKDFTKPELSYEDARALRRAARKLSSYDFSDNDNPDNIKNVVSAFVETYNHTISSTRKSESADIKHLSKQLKRITKDHEEELKKVGISIERDGSLKVNDGLLKLSSVENLKKTFAKKESNYLKSTITLTKRLSTESYDELYRQMTGNGGIINIQL